MHTEQLKPTINAANDYLDSFIDEAKAADFLCQSIRTLQNWALPDLGRISTNPVALYVITVAI
jgi:hypothetical protein